MPGQAVVMTYPLIGNYGICKSDMSQEGFGRRVTSLGSFLEASNFRNECTMDEFLKRMIFRGGRN